jgi:formate hydrogenlyase transcriptional activator
MTLDLIQSKPLDADARASLARLQAAVDLAGLGFYLMSDAGEKIALENRTRELLGIPPEEEARTRAFFQRHIHPDDLGRVLDISAGVFTGTVDHRSVEYRYLHPVRGLIWHSHSIRAFERDADGKVTRIAGVIQDVSESKRAEQAARHSEDRLASAIEVAALGLYEVIDGAAVTYADRRCRDLFGLGDDRVGTAALEFWIVHLHPDDYPRLLDLHEQLNDGRLDRTSVAYRYLHPDRGLIWIEQVTHVVARQPSGQAHITLGVMRDVTDAKWHETALRESEEVNRATFEQAAVGIAHVGTSGEWLRYNDKLCAILGYARHELAGLTFQDVTHPDDLAADLESLHQVLTGRSACYSMEKRYIRKDGSPVWANLTVSLVRDAAGHPKHFISIVEDITARKQAEETLASAHAEVQRLREQLERENTYLRQEARSRKHPGRIVGRSAAIREVLADIEKVAPTLSTVLLSGETGTGKELFATAIHAMSARRDRTMVRVNCAAIPATLIESELFGREKGAYTGAVSRQVGRFELANGSTIFLDEIGDLPADIQVKLLRVLQERQIERLGSPRPISVDIRIIAASNRDLERDVREGRFREDLFYRLNVFPVRVPPLRERLEDIPVLVEALVGELGPLIGKRFHSVSRESLEGMTRYSWPGNVRELRNVVERAMILAAGPELEIQAPGAAPSPPSVAADEPLAAERIETLDRDGLVRVLQQTGWRIRGARGAAAVLGLKPTTLEYRMAKLGIKRP